MKLVSERGINRTLKTIDRRGKKIEFPYKFDDNLIVTQPWNMKNFMVLDIIADIYIRKYCNKLNLDIPKSPYDSNVLEFSKNMTKDSNVIQCTISNIGPIDVK